MIMSVFGRRIDPEESLAHTRDSTSLDSGTGETGDQRPDPQDQPFLLRDPLATFDDLILPEETRRQIDLVLSLVEHHEVLYGDWGLSKIDPDGRHLGINLYGEPGTGKTRCADALAHALGKQLIDVSYAEIESKYVGETGKNIVRAFEAATEADAVLLFDEADSILGQRMTNVTQAADHGVNVARAVMLKQLDAYRGVVIFATNLARNFDSAFVRRIPQHVEIPLPDEMGRGAILRLMIGEQVPGRSELDWCHLAGQSQGLSGGDIKNAVVAALTRAVARNDEARRICTSDLLCALADVAKAKASVGTGSCLLREEVPIQSIPQSPKENCHA
jgi:SpoVK/Ycf46/Vps4 family AAA+-type ATPase